MAPRSHTLALSPTLADSSIDDLEAVAGKKDELVGRLQQRYGMQRDAAEADVDKWIKQI